ncbi:MAG: nitrous oxide reductase accessory protein NosL [Phycisphaerales bacterium]
MTPSIKYLVLVAPLALVGCAEPDPDAPPTVLLGDSVCVQCNMIISDERWATATVVEGPRGPEPLLFDDFNCQVNYEAEHPDRVVLTRWSRCHSSGEWMRTEDAHFLMSPNLRTPMGSMTAAFETEDAAGRTRSQLEGDVMTFEIAWKRLGFPGACCDAEDCDETAQTSEASHDTP